MCINISGQIHQPGSLSRSMRTSRSSGCRASQRSPARISQQGEFTGENRPKWSWNTSFNQQHMGISPAKICQNGPKKGNKCEFDQPKWWFHPPFMVVFMGKWWRTMWFLGLSSNKAIISYHFHENSPTESLNHLKKCGDQLDHHQFGLVECPVSQGGISRILQDGDPQSLPYVCCFINTMKTSIHYSYSML